MVALILVHIEGGGPTRKTQTPLREGFDSFCRPLKDLAERHRVRLRFNVAGSRDQAYQDFLIALHTYADAWNVLLVDSEEAVIQLPLAHLQRRDGWDFAAAREEQFHLMTQCMEAWLLADPDAVAEYYKEGFNSNALPKRIDLEDEPKAQIYAALEAATRQTQKGRYAKIKHASDLLKRVSQEKARSRCKHCDRFFRTVAEKIESAD